MTETAGQEGQNPKTAAETPVAAIETVAPEAGPEALAEVILAEALLDGPDETGQSPELLLNNSEALDDPDFFELLTAGPEADPLETAAVQPNTGGGASVYQSDFGDLLGGLQASGSLGEVAGGRAPGNGFSGSENDDSLSPPPGLTLAAQTAPAELETDAELPFVPPLDPVGPGADQALFTDKADNVDLNGIDVGGYLDGTQYDAGRGNDVVTLPATAREALEAGFVPGTLFDAGPGNDQVTGGGLADLIAGGIGRDLLSGAGGDDSLWGGNGTDTLDGSLGNDLLDGGNNNDSLSGGSGDDSLLGGGGRDTLLGGEGNDLLNGANGNDSLSGGSGDDSLIGGGGRDTLDGGLDNDLLLGDNNHDLLIGGDGDDSLWGGAHNDTLDGGNGSDLLFGDGGRDLLIGGAGDDVMSGGAGRDSFSFSLTSDEGTDLILDFKTGNNGDNLRITDLIDVNGDSVIDVADLDAGGHSVSGAADSVVIAFDTGTTITLQGINGTGVDSFTDLLDIKVNIDIA